MRTRAARRPIMSSHTITEVIVNRILVVEDDKGEAEFLKTFLEKKKFTVEIARDAGQARAAFTMHQPDFVILDVILPNDVSGFEVCEWMKTQADGVPVVILTAIELEDSIDLARRVGADEYVTKPYDPDELIKTIHDVADKVWEKKHRSTADPNEKVKFECPECGKHLRVQASYRGRLLNCPKCGQQVQVPRSA